MSREALRATVIEIRPKALYRVRLQDGRVITANVEASLRRVIVRIVENDQVLVRLSVNDPQRGQIVALCQ